MAVENKSVSSPKSIWELSPYDCAGLLALIRSRAVWRPISPTRDLTLKIMKRLKDRGIIDVPWPQMDWTVSSDGHTTPHEKLGWRFVWPNHIDYEIDLYLTERLCHWPWNEDDTEERLKLWADVACAEVTDYAAKKLTEHKFDPAWADDLEYVRKECGRLPIAKWRYVVWAAIRHGASEYLRSGNSPDHTRRAIMNEYRKRFKMIHNGLAHLGTFAPSNLLPYSLLAQALTENVIPLKDAYWLDEPYDWAEKQIAL